MTLPHPSTSMAVVLASTVAFRCKDAKETSTGWIARCPTHEDSTPSLSIDTGADKVLLLCRAGCPTDGVLRALDLTWADLFIQPKGKWVGDLGKIVATYDYVDAQGVLQHQTVRFQPDIGEKQFRQRRPNPGKKSGWEWSLKGIAPVLYHLPEVLAAIQQKKLVYLVEGEKDADNVQKLGLVATTNAMGAAYWKASYDTVLCGAHLVILPDYDQPGIARLHRLAHRLQPRCASIRILLDIHTAAPKSDVSDWLAAGGTRAQLEAAVNDASPWSPPVASSRGQEGASGTKFPDGFRVDDTGVWYTQPTGLELEIWVCARLDIVAATRDVDNNNHGNLLTFHDRHGHPQQWAMPLELLEEQREYRKVLRRLGLKMHGSAKNPLQLYLEGCDAQKLARCVDKVGWYDGAYVLPDTTLGEHGEEQLVLQNDEPRSEGYRQQGTLKEWKQAIAARCVGNSRLLLAVSTGFAAPLLTVLDEEAGGLHYRGSSSEGKTTAAIVAGSVWGEPGRLENWRATSNGLEGVALLHNDNLLCLDELKQIDPREAGHVAYMLANGVGKRRGKEHGGTRARLKWRLLFLSTGELSLEKHIADAGQRIQAGQEVRMVDVPADAGKGYGLFEDLHGSTTGEAFAETLKAQAAQHYGASRFEPWREGEKGETCQRCHGTGKVAYNYLQGVCFTCNGMKVITPDHPAIRLIQIRAGWSKATDDGGTEFYVQKEVFRQDIARGLDVRWLCRVLKDKGYLLPDSRGKFIRSESVPGQPRTDVYRIKAALLGEQQPGDKAADTAEEK